MSSAVLRINVLLLAWPNQEVPSFVRSTLKIKNHHFALPSSPRNISHGPSHLSFAGLSEASNSPEPQTNGQHAGTACSDHHGLIEQVYASPVYQGLVVLIRREVQEASTGHLIVVVEL